MKDKKQSLYVFRKYQNNMIELIILDMYRTIYSSSKPIRNGLNEFFQRYENKIFVIATDDPDKNAVNERLDEMKIAKYIKEIYTANDLVAVEGKYGIGKNLGSICEAHNVAKNSAIFIGDGDRDRIDSEREEIRFIHVPEYMDKNEKFSFDMIDLENIPTKYKDFRTVND